MVAHYAYWMISAMTSNIPTAIYARDLVALTIDNML